MRYVSALTDAELRQELLADLNGLTVGSTFILSSTKMVDDLLRQCDAAAFRTYEENIKQKKPAEVECITLTLEHYIGYDCLRSMDNMPENPIIVPVYRYFDTPRETIVAAAICAPSDMKKTQEVTFFCGPDRRKTGDYRIFSIHPGPRRQVFPSRYQPEAQRRNNREYWDRHVFLATPNQIIAAKMMMRANFNSLEEQAKDRVFHMTRQMESALHRWYATYEQVVQSDDLRTVLDGTQTVGAYGMAPDGTVYFYLSAHGVQMPDLRDFAALEPKLHNKFKPAVIKADGSEEYYDQGKRHREGAPAVIQPLEDGGWMEVWYERGLISRLPEEGSAKIIYNAKGEVTKEIAIYQGAEVEATTLGEAAEPIKALQNQLEVVAGDITWFEGSQDFALLRGQLIMAASRIKSPLEKVIRQMQAKDEQVGMRWDFDRTLEQDERVRADFDRLTANIDKLGTLLVEGSQAMRFVRGDSNIINGIWGKILRELDRLIERGKGVPAKAEGKTAVDELIEAKNETKKYFQSSSDLNKVFSATGR
jgi:hypothetical protein